MTYREKPQQGPTRLFRAEYEIDIINSINARSSSYTSERYGHQEIRDALESVYKNKCAYCETKIEPVATAHIDHHRPINTYIGQYPNGQRQDHLGYYWLGYEWTNLVLSCPACNGTKSSKYHLVNPESRLQDAPPLVNNRPNYPEHLVNSATVAQENPYLINPEIIDPDLHLTINYFGLLEPIDNSQYGKATIDTCDLNWDPLYQNRLDILSETIDSINKELFQRYRGDELALTEGQFKLRLFWIFDEITKRTLETEEYNMVGRCMIVKFEELILEDIEPIYRKKIMKYFEEYLQVI